MALFLSLPMLVGVGAAFFPSVFGDDFMKSR